MTKAGFPGFLCGSAAFLAAFMTTVRADVSIQQKTSLDVASMIRMHGATTTNLTGDKKREDTESHCEGVMSLLCGNLQGGEIVRLDRDVTWHLEPAKKRYREQTFATPEELAAMRAKMQANLEKMRSCPVSQKQQPIDKSKCTMSPPKFEVHKTDDKVAIAGHDAQRTSATMTETCTDKESGDVCDTVVALDVWLTQDSLPGSGDRRAFDAAYAKKLGLDDPQGIMRGEAAKFLAPYQSQIKQLTDKSGDFKGQPLKTSLRVMMGGPQCKSKAKAGDSRAAAPRPARQSDERRQGSGQGDRVLDGRPFQEEKGRRAARCGGRPRAGRGFRAPDPYSQYVQLASFSMETVRSTPTQFLPRASRFRRTGPRKCPRLQKAATTNSPAPNHKQCRITSSSSAQASVDWPQPRGSPAAQGVAHHRRRPAQPSPVSTSALPGRLRRCSRPRRSPGRYGICCGGARK